MVNLATDVCWFLCDCVEGLVLAAGEEKREVGVIYRGDEFSMTPS